MSRSELIFGNIVANRAESDPDLDVLTIEDGARPAQIRTYRELWHNGQRLAAALRALGLAPGDHFAILMANHAEFVEAMVAASITGTVFVPIDPRTRGGKLVFLLDSALCRGVIVADYCLPTLMEVKPRLHSLGWTLCLASGELETPATLPAGVADYATSLPADLPDLPVATVDPGAPMELIFTSGTTGDPKGIVMTHRRFCETSAVVPRMVGYQPTDRLYSGLSLTHANAQGITLGAALCARMRCVISRRFTKSRLWDISRRYGCTTFTLLGGMTTAVYAEPPRTDDADNPVRFVIAAGMPAAIWRKFERRFDVKILEFYGAAEGGLAFNHIGAGPVGSIGKPAPNLDYRIVDADGRDLPRDARGERCGELLFRAKDGSPFKVEYFANPEASAHKCRDGWLWMGDIVREDAEGWLYFEYRKGGGIRRNGDFVNPGFVEKVIAECDNVDDVYVWGIAAGSGAPGEKDVVAAIVPRDGARFDPQAVFRSCRSHLEPNFVPSFIQVLDAIPKTASEKPQERFLEDLFAQRRQQVFTEKAS